MRRWWGPLFAGIVVALVACQLTLVAMPRVLMAAAVRRVGAAGMNRMFHGPLPTAASRQIVRPSPDLAYSSCPFDLADGPITVHVAPVPAGYWSLSVFDARTDVAFIRNNADSGGKAIDVTVALPDQPVPAGRDAVRVSGARGIALIRILVDDRNRFPAIDAARRASFCRRG